MPYIAMKLVIFFEVVSIPSGDRSLLGSPNIQQYEDGELGSWLMLESMRSLLWFVFLFWFVWYEVVKPFGYPYVILVMKALKQLH